MLPQRVQHGAGAARVGLALTRLKRRDQVVTDAFAYAYTPRDPGLLVSGATLPPDDLSAAFAALLGETFRMRHEEVSANELALHAEQLERTQRALKKAREILAKCECEADNRREQVGEATREMKAIEVLRDRALAEQRREQGLREQRDADETSSRKGVKRP